MEKIQVVLASPSDLADERQMIAGREHELNLALDSYHKRRKPDIKAFFKVIDESEKNDDTRKISAISKKLQPLGLYTPFKDISELKDNVSKIIQAELMNLIRKLGQVKPEIHQNNQKS